MKRDNDSLVHRQMPEFMEETQILKDYLQSLSYDDLQSIWKASDNLTRQNFERIQVMDLYSNLTPAILSFQGLQYQYMGSDVFSYEELDYLEEHLRILSGFYGIVRPFDGIVPYRLEMKSKLIDWKYSSLYSFWEDKIAKKLFGETGCIIDLASVEYSRAISKYLDDDTSMIKLRFGQIIQGRVIEKGTLAKMARGDIVRFMAENKIEDPQEIKKYNRLDYVFREDLSDPSNYVFIEKEEERL